MQIFADEMLKKTAKWLRIFGISVAFLSGMDDSEIADMVRLKKGILLTRDAALATRCAKNGVEHLFLADDSIHLQLAAVLKRIDRKIEFPKNTRCPMCDAALTIVKKEDVRALVPPHVLESQDKFWKCSNCGKVYWIGGHWRNIKKMIEAVEKEMEKR